VERFLQYLDDLEDFIYAVPLIAEQLRRAIQRILFLIASILLQIGGVILALSHPPLALAVVTLMLVALLYRAVIVPMPQTVSAN
jgi:hypothetical protein